MGREHLRVFIATGNSGVFRRLLQATRSLATEPGVELFVQRGAAPAEFCDLPGESFISREDFAERLAWADLTVCHGGAGTLYEAYLAGHTPIVMPRLARYGEHINDHQLELARALAAEGRAILCESERALVGLTRTTPVRRAPPPMLRDGLTGAVRKALFSANGDDDRPALALAFWSLSRSLIERMAESQVRWLCNRTSSNEGHAALK